MENPPMDDIERVVFNSTTLNPFKPLDVFASDMPSTSRNPTRRTPSGNDSDGEGGHRTKGASRLGMIWGGFLSPFSPNSELAGVATAEQQHPPPHDRRLQAETPFINASSPMPLHFNRSTPSLDYHLIHPQPTTAFSTPTFELTPTLSSDDLPHCGGFMPHRHSAPARPPPPSSRRFLPRLFGALGSPSRERKSKGKGRASDDSLDFDDEACFVDIKETSGMDIISHLPSEIALYILIHLDLPSVMVCFAVSRYWRTLSFDPLIWRELFIRQGWSLNSTGVAHQLRSHQRHVAPPIPPSPPPTRRFSLHRRSLTTGTPSLRHRASTISNDRFNDAASTVSAAAIARYGDYAPLSLDWLGMFKIRKEVDHRWKSTEPKISNLSGHQDSVYCLEFDSDKIVTGSRDRTIKVWSLHTGELRNTLRGHTGSVLCLKFDHTGFMVSGSSDRSILVWDLNTSSMTHVIHGHSGGVLDLRIDMNWIVSCSKDAIIRVYNRHTMALYCVLQGHEGPVNAVGLQGDKVVSASGDGKMMLWDLTTRTRIRTFEGHDRGLACIDFKGDTIISGSNDRKIKVWSASTGECIQTLAGHDLLVRALAFNPLLGKLVSASYDKTVKVWDLKTGACVREFKDFHSSHIFDVKFDATRIISSSHDEKVVILDFGWDLDTTLFD